MPRWAEKKREYFGDEEDKDFVMIMNHSKEVKNEFNFEEFLQKELPIPSNNNLLEEQPELQPILIENVSTSSAAESLPSVVGTKAKSESHGATFSSETSSSSRASSALPRSSSTIVPPSTTKITTPKPLPISSSSNNLKQNTATPRPLEQSKPPASTKPSTPVVSTPESTPAQPKLERSFPTSPSTPSPSQAGGMIPEQMYTILQEQMKLLEAENKKLQTQLQAMQSIATFKKQEKENDLFDEYLNSETAKNLDKMKPQDLKEDMYVDLLDEGSTQVLKVAKSLKATSVSKAIISKKFKEIMTQNINEVIESEGSLSSTSLEQIRTGLPTYEMYELSRLSLEHQEQEGLGLMYQLRSVDQKCQLLDLMNEAYANCSEFLMPVILFCEQTLEFKLFLNKVLKPRPGIARLYINWLKANYEWDQLFRVLKSLDYQDDLHFLQLELALRTTGSQQTPDRLFDRLEACLHDLQIRKGFPEEERSFQKRILEQQLNLLSRQVKIEEHDQKVAAKNAELIYLQNPRWNIINGTLSDTVFYCLLYHPFAELGKLSSPKSFRQDFSISNKRYHWLALHARVQVKDWKSVMGLFYSLYPPGSEQNAGGITSMLKSVLGFGAAQNPNYVVDITPQTFIQVVASQRDYPEDLIEKFLEAVPDVEERYSLAKQFKAFMVSVNCLVHMRNRQGLIELRQYLTDRFEASEISAIRAAIDNALYKSKTKWKN